VWKRYQLVASARPAPSATGRACGCCWPWPDGGEVAAGVSRLAASNQLARLPRAGLVACRREERHHYYRLASPSVGELLRDVGPG
jgi:DNA-binding transcriptional ArsR family regulator